MAGTHHVSGKLPGKGLILLQDPIFVRVNVPVSGLPGVNPYLQLLQNAGILQIQVCNFLIFD